MYKTSGIKTIYDLPSKKKLPILVALPDALRSSKSRNDTLELAKHSEEFRLDSGGRQRFLATQGHHSKYKHCTSESDKPIVSGNTLNLHISHFKEAIDLFKPAWVVGLDAPIRPSKNPREQEKRFKESLDINFKWAAETIALRDKYFPQTKVVLPLQCQCVENLRYYWQLIKNLNCNGVALPMRCFKNDGLLIDFLMAIYDLGICDAHLLGSCRFGAICISAYLANNNFFNTISMDSGTWRLSADKGKLVVPYDLREVHIDDKKTLQERTRKLPTSWQKKITNVLIHAGGRKEHKALREFNYNSIDSTIKDIEKHSASPFEMQEFLLNRSTRIDDIINITKMLELIPMKVSTLN